jgi:hypothetical protein
LIYNEKQSKSGVSSSTEPRAVGQTMQTFPTYSSADECRCLCDKVTDSFQDNLSISAFSSVRARLGSLSPTANATTGAIRTCDRTCASCAWRFATLSISSSCFSQALINDAIPRRSALDPPVLAGPEADFSRSSVLRSYFFGAYTDSDCGLSHSPNPSVPGHNIPQAAQVDNAYMGVVDCSPRPSARLCLLDYFHLGTAFGGACARASLKLALICALFGSRNSASCSSLRPSVH